MHVSLDEVVLDLPATGTLGELMDGVAPQIGADRLVVHVPVDGVAVDTSQPEPLAQRRLRGTEAVDIRTEEAASFVASRRRELPVHLGRIASVLDVAARGFTAGQEADAYRCVALASQELKLVLDLDHSLAQLEASSLRCGALRETVRRVGPGLEAAVRGSRTREVAALLVGEMLPALRDAIRDQEGQPR
jgi:hypothetical protein